MTDNRELIQDEAEDPELAELARAEIEELTVREQELENKISLMLLPGDPNDEKNIFLEIRAGTGGDEAALFVADLFRMFSRYAEMQGWKVEIMSSNPIGIGGFKELIALISGDQVYSRLNMRLVCTVFSECRKPRPKDESIPLPLPWLLFRRLKRWTCILNPMS